MTYKKDAYYIYVTFDNVDWRTGLAPECIEAIKKEIPLTERNYNPDTRIWQVDNRHDELILEFYNRDKDPNQLELF